LGIVVGVCGVSAFAVDLAFAPEDPARSA